MSWMMQQLDEALDDLEARRAEAIEEWERALESWRQATLASRATLRAGFLSLGVVGALALQLLNMAVGPYWPLTLVCVLASWVSLAGVLLQLREAWRATRLLKQAPGADSPG